jgi:hypothetical protein
VRGLLPGTDLSALVAAMCVDCHCPDFLSPAPLSASVGSDEELEQLRHTPAEVVVDQVCAIIRDEKESRRALHPEEERMLQAPLRNPERSVAQLVDALGRYHELAVAPYWPWIWEHLEGDTIRRGQALAFGGVESLLSGLNPKVAYVDGALVIDTTFEGTVEAAGRG